MHTINIIGIEFVKLIQINAYFVDYVQEISSLYSTTEKIPLLRSVISNRFKQ